MKNIRLNAFKWKLKLVVWTQSEFKQSSLKRDFIAIKSKLSMHLSWIKLYNLAQLGFGSCGDIVCLLDPFV